MSLAHSIITHYLFWPTIKVAPLARGDSQLQFGDGCPTCHATSPSYQIAFDIHYQDAAKMRVVHKDRAPFSTLGLVCTSSWQLVPRLRCDYLVDWFWELSLFSTIRRWWDWRPKKRIIGGYNTCGHEIPTANQSCVSPLWRRTRMPSRRIRIDTQTAMQNIPNQCPGSIRIRLCCTTRKRKSMMSRCLANSKRKPISCTGSFQAYLPKPLLLLYQSQLG